MRTPGQRKEIYNIVKARLEKGMSGRSARANINYDGKVFDLDFKTWKTYAAEFDGSLPEEGATSHPGPDREQTSTPMVSAIPFITAPALPRHAGRKPGVHKMRFLVIAVGQPPRTVKGRGRAEGQDLCGAGHRLHHRGARTRRESPQGMKRQEGAKVLRTLASLPVIADLQIDQYYFQCGYGRLISDAIV